MGKQGNAGYASKGQKVVAPGKGGKMGGHDAMVTEKSKSVGAKKMPAHTMGAMDCQKTMG